MGVWQTQVPTPDLYLVGTSSTPPTKDNSGKYNVTCVGNLVMDPSGNRGYSFPITSSGGAAVTYITFNYPFTTSVFSISMWLRFTGTNTNSFGDFMSINTNWYLQSNGSTGSTINMNVILPSGSPGGSTTLLYTSPLWFNVIPTYDGVNTSKLYVNNQLWSTATTAGPTLTTSTPVYLCCYTTANAYTSANGLMNSIYMYNRVLTDSERANVYANT